MITAEIADQYLSMYRIAPPRWERVPCPQTVEQCQSLFDRHGDEVLHLLPPRRDWASLGIVPAAEPFSQEWRRRFIQTLRVDEDFADACRFLIGGGQ